MKNLNFSKLLLVAVLLSSFLSPRMVLAQNAIATRVNTGAEFIRVKAISKELVQFQACRFADGQKIACRQLGKGAYSIDEISALKSKVNRDFWLPAVGTLVAAAAVAIASTIAAPGIAILGTGVATGVGGGSLAVFAGSVIIFSAAFGATYGAAVCPKMTCVVIGALAGAATGALHPYLMLGTTYVIAPIANGVLTARVSNWFFKMTDSFKLMSKMYGFEDQIEKNHFDISIETVEAILGHLPAHALPSTSETVLVHP